MKSKITRKNRDRQGGHQAQLNTSVGSVEILPKMKKFIKQQSVKKIRRDHAKALRGAEQEYQDEVHQNSCYFWGYEDESFDCSGYDFMEYMEDVEENPYDTYEHDFLDFFFEESEYLITEDRHDNFIVVNQDVGKTLGELLREAAERFL
jgi:hypothetical protein